MNISRFFIDRPIFAAVLSLLIFIAGLISLGQLPISEYPEVVPPSVVVHAQYPGANPKVIAETVAAPLEEQVNGVENMLYMFSQGTSDGQMNLTITFKLGTDPDKAQQLVQNRVNQALPRLPDIVRQFGVTTIKSSPDLTMVVHILSPKERYDELYLGNYTSLNVKDRLARIPGVGQAQIFGGSDYAMRVWLDPQKIAARSMNASDVIAAIREQNIQVAPGVIGSSPSPTGLDLQLNINAQGRLQTEEEFGEVIIKTSPDGAVTRLKDVARIELGAAQYALRSLLDNKPAVAVGIFQTPGSNALEVSDSVRRTMEELKKEFPEDVDYTIVYDPTTFVRDSIKAVVHTLLEAIALVVLVVILFLQTWRASIIPLLAVPVSIVGTFALMLMFGFSINALSLFGLVLAIGIVVDDAIVVVENVERNIANGLSPKDATYQAMREVSGPIIAIGLTLIAVFVPIAFISGLTGQFYSQFALTIAISTVISAFNSLTLSPAMAALLLKDHHAPKDWLTRVMDNKLGWLFARFNHLFDRSSKKYSGMVGSILQRKALAMTVYVGLIGLTFFGFWHVPTGYIPQQDKQYLIGFAQLPDAASLDRTDEVMRRMSEIGLKTPGIANAVAFPGLSINGFTNSSSAGIVFYPLKPFDERTSSELSAGAIVGSLNAQFGGIKDAFTAVFPPPAVMGLGTIGGFKMQIEDRGDLGDEVLSQTMKEILGKAWQNPKLAGMFTGFQINVPQLYVELDRTKAKQMGISIDSIFQTMQIYLGSLYINDFNKFGRTYQVIAQADAPFRAHPEDITQLKVRNISGDMVPLESVLTVAQSYGPDRAMRYNGYRTAEINGGPAPGISSGDAQAEIEKIVMETMPKGMSFEWTDLTYQKILTGDTAMLVFPLCVLLVFLVLAAQYESLTLPLAVILIVPMCMLCAITGVWLVGGDNNIFTQIGLIVLVGLACKNAILIVEFARELELEGKTPVQAAVTAAHLRLRPILMTSFAFIMGVVPLVFSSGAGAEMRHAMGIAVFSGMLGVTFFGLFLTPVFYVLLRTLAGSKLTSASEPALHAEAEEVKP
ncbi:MAG: transporter [Rickettsiales bacterium]|jgi:multidrug efflux pump|nr:transporter [Rickettsiales bacterium]